MTRFRRLRLWWKRQHAYSRCWLWCQDCRWAQQAWAAGEFYVHDDPRWYLNETLSRSPNVITAPVEIGPPPTGPNLTIIPGAPSKPGPLTYATGATKVWIVR